MKTFSLLLISLLIASNTFSQASVFGTINDSSSITNPTFAGMYNNNFNSQSSDKVHLSFQTGVSFYSFGKQSIFDKWLAPELTYNLTSKFHITAGAVAIFSNYGFQNSLNNEGNKAFSLNNTGQYFLFAQGEYLLSNRITLRGTILKEVPDKSINPYAINYNSVGVNFKISDRLSISADYTIAKGYNSSLMRNNGFNMSAIPSSGDFYNRTW